MGSSLFERLGGTTAITAVVDDFSARCDGDARINAKFARTDIARLKAMLVDQVSEASGGPAKYTGRDMKTAHLDMRVTTGEFNALVEDLALHVGQPPLGHGRGRVVEPALRVRADAVIDEEPGRPGQRRALGQHEPGVLLVV